jgi:hypothetical protein
MDDPLLEQNLAVRPVQKRSPFLMQRPQAALATHQTQDASSFSLHGKQEQQALKTTDERGSRRVLHSQV